MAPIVARATGISPQRLDDPSLKTLLEDLRQLSTEVEVMQTTTIPQLVRLLEPFHADWILEEQVDLHEWIHPLNVLDAALRWMLQEHSKSILLVAPVQDKRTRRNDYNKSIELIQVANSQADLDELPSMVCQALRQVLRFTAVLLRNATAKSLYNSVFVLLDLLGAADEETADGALSALTALALPSPLHKQSSPEQQVHTTALHQLVASSLVRLTTMARGWGTAAAGLGLVQTVAADDSTHGQGNLPQEAGMVYFEYYDEEQDSLARISLTESDMDEAGDTREGQQQDPASKKRRRVASRKPRSNAELFFLALKKAGGRDRLPADRLFSLLVDVWLARSFHCRETRVVAVERRLRALVCLLHAHPSQEILSGYFQAQPELCVELVDLLRPTVSAANVSAAAAAQTSTVLPHVDAIAAMAGYPDEPLPFSVRMLALEALTSLISRRDGATGGLSGTARLSSVLTELGVAKGQYLGFLPTLIRFSLASIGSMANLPAPVDPPTDVPEALQVGLAFVQATVPRQLPRMEQVERALDFIDNVLTLTSSVVATPTGTSALVDCGLIPALLAIVAVDPQKILLGLLPQSEVVSQRHVQRVLALLRFVTAQAVQIIEGAIVTHNNALTAFHDLLGVEVLTTRLSQEILATRQASTEVKLEDESGDVKMAEAHEDEEPRILSSQRVLLFSIVTCLTVVFHQESSSSTTTVPTGGAQLRKKELTDALIAITDDVVSYGGHLASLVATLLSDVMNSDPHVVHYVHSSGIAQSFLNMVAGKKSVDASGNEQIEPIVPAVPELVMAIPSVLSALALTEDGAKAVKEANPFPSLLRLFYHPDYAMPKSRCLLNELTSIVGTGLDEIMRHVEQLKPLILKAIADAMNQLVAYADDLALREEQAGHGQYPMTAEQEALETERTCLIQYVLNFGRLLEQILHNEDHCGPFVDAGGLDALLRLFPSTMPTGLQFLAHLSCLSSPSVSTLHHSTIEESLSLASKCLEFRYDAKKLLRKISETANQYLDSLDESHKELFGSDEPLFSLDRLPQSPFYEVFEGGETELLKATSAYLRGVARVEWITSVLATAIKAACQRSQDSGGWSRVEKEWKKEISSDSFERLVNRLSTFHRSAVFEVCRVRTDESGVEAQESSSRLRYRLRIVCPEGAVVRDGIEIDSCASVGSMEMGEIVDSFDRCINSSGILRYRTPRGWVSELTRGHGREPIAEVIRMWRVQDDCDRTAPASGKRRMESPIPSLRTVAVGVLARGQTSYSELFGALSKLVMQGIRALPSTAVSFEDGTPGKHVAGTMKLLSTDLRNGFEQANVARAVRNSDDDGALQRISRAGAAMYLGSMLNHLQACLFDDKRERRVVNFLLLVSLVASDSFVEIPATANVFNQDRDDDRLGIFNATRYILKHGLGDFEARAATPVDAMDGSKPRQRADRSVAASFPPLITLLRRLMSTPLSLSPAASILSRMTWKDVSSLLGEDALDIERPNKSPNDAFFQPEGFARGLQAAVSRVVKEAWDDERLVHAPPYLVHPLASLVGEIIICLEEASKRKPSGDTPRSEGRLLLSDLLRRRREDTASNEVQGGGFEASENAISQLMAMGFTRDHALDAIESTQSNRVEVAMDYALSHVPPDRQTIERRRAEREERARRRSEAQASASVPEGNESGQAVAVGVQDNGEGPGEETAADTEAPSEMDVEATGDNPRNNDEESHSAKEEGKDSGKDQEIARAKAELKDWITDVASVATKLLCSIKPPENRTDSMRSESGDGETEGLTVVMSSLLLDLCHRYQDRRSEIVGRVFKALKGMISTREDDGVLTFSVGVESEASVAALCHASVLFARALPKARILLLGQGLCRALVSSIETLLSSTSDIQFPMWIAPALLLLDVMAQPIVAFSDVSVDSKEDEISDSELEVVRGEHKTQAENLAAIADRVFAMMRCGEETPQSETEKGGGSEDSEVVAPTDPMEVEKGDNDSAGAKVEQSPFATVPAYFPLIPLDLSRSCLDICLRLLGCSKASTEKIHLPPGVAHSCFLLLLRLLRAPKNSSRCLQEGLAEAILALPKTSKFTGRTGLATLLFKRLIEDEATLQTAMETEIRSTVSKLYAKNNPQAHDDNPKVTLAALVDAITPLLSREPVSLFRAIALSVKLEGGAEESSEMTASLVSATERSRRAEGISLIFSSRPLRHREEPTRVKRGSSAGRSKSKSPQKGPRRGSFAKKHRREKGDVTKVAAPTGESPACHVTSLLMNDIMAGSQTTGESIRDDVVNDDDESFLWEGNLLEVLADLVLAVPACASAVHNYRPVRGKDKAKKSFSNLQIRHALPGCQDPPKTFVTYLLHSHLPQDRWSLKQDPQLWERRKDDDEGEADLIKRKKGKAYRVMKMSQYAARVLVALVARPGEGRKRVISDLVFALSGGSLGHGIAASKTAASERVDDSTNGELFALHAWGELCLGFAAPRSNGKHLDGMASLSIENVRLMLEHGMVHALLYAVHRVKLFHPMASSTCSALLLPLEILTRSTVTNAVKDHVKAGRRKKENDMVEDGEPELESGEPYAGDAVSSAEYENNDEQEPEHQGDAIEYEVLVEAEENNMDDVEFNNDAEMDEAGDDEASDEDGDPSSEESEEESTDDELDESGSDESGEEESEDVPSEEVDDDGDWNIDYNAFPTEHLAPREEFEEADEDGTDRMDQDLQDLDEGWTTIESSGFGGMLVGRSTRAPLQEGETMARSQGFMEAAEAMIGTLLRSGEISGEALAEIEGSLGIRIMPGGAGARAFRAAQRPSDGSGDMRDGLLLRGTGGRLAVQRGGERTRRGDANRGDIIGTLPHVHQRSQPEVGNAAFSRSGQWVEISSMEYVYGGPSVTAGSRNYDLTSPIQEDSESDQTPNLSVRDLQLFPDGPAVAASARTQLSVHPLLCGVDLPPINSLVSDLLPHGVRATRRGQMATRRAGEWTNGPVAPGGYLVSTSNGSIIRSSRTHSGAPLGSGLTGRNFAGPVGWTDDGLPVDATVQEFSSAFGRALRETTRSQAENSRSSSDDVDNATDEQATEGAAEEAPTNEGATSEPAEGAREETIQPPVAGGDDHPDETDADQETTRSDGGMASSLAAGLRLSPGSAASGQSDAMTGVNQEEAPDPEESIADAPHADSEMVEAVEPDEAHATSAPETGNESAGPPDNGNGTSTVNVPESDGPADSAEEHNAADEANSSGLTCPPEVDPEVFNSLPREMQQEFVDQYNATQELAAQLDGSSLDPEVLAALPEEMRREVIEQDRRDRMREQVQDAPADPSQAEDMDNGDFIASLSPELREEILLTADEAFLNSLPPNIIAEAQIVRERASSQNRTIYDDAVANPASQENGNAQGAGVQERATQAENTNVPSSRRRHRLGRLRVEYDRDHVVYLPESLSDPISRADLKALVQLMYLMSPVRPPRLLQKIFQNLCGNETLRNILTTVFVKLMHEDGKSAVVAIDSLENEYAGQDDWRRKIDKMFVDADDFPPVNMLGTVPDIPDTEAFSPGASSSLLRRRQGTATSGASSVPTSGSNRSATTLSPVVAGRFVDTLIQLCKASPRFSVHSLLSPLLESNGASNHATVFEKLLELLEKPMYAKSSSNLDQLLTLLECVVSPLSYLAKHGEEDVELSQKEIDTAADAGKEWVEVPRVTVSQSRLQLLCSILGMESCRDTAFNKVNTIVRRLCRIETNRGYVLAELASVAHRLGADALRDLKALRMRMDAAVAQHQLRLHEEASAMDDSVDKPAVGSVSSSVTLSTSTGELKLLRVLQTLQALCGDGDESGSKKNESTIFVTEELVHLLRQMKFDDLWNELSACLKLVQVLEGVKTTEEANEAADAEDVDNADDGSANGSGEKSKKLRTAGLLTRFLPSIEAFFVANASTTRPLSEDGETPSRSNEDITLEHLVEGKRVIEFVSTNRAILNALIRNSPGLMDKGLRGLVQVPRCRVCLDFDVKRQWFKTQVRRLRQHASRRHGSLRLQIRRKFVFEDAYHQLRLRNAEEMRGRLHITFRDEEGVDAGGLSREFFGILAKEIFNPNYALFTSTEDGCTFQPNPHSAINGDHLSYFRFVGRIVGKALADGFLLDAHFTRSLYKHMLGMEPTHHDMEAIDPDFYRNLKTILEYNLDDLGLDLTFSTEDHSFGRNQIVDLLKDGRKVAVTEENKEKYVRLVCQHRMTNAIQSQIKAYLDGFYELVSPDLIAIFSPKELELLISGLPDIDVHDLKKNTDYVGWKATDKEIEWFWNILFSLSRNEKASFLQFVTGSSKVPLAGFAELQGMRGVQKFSIHKAGGAKGALMSAHTCFNSLDLPTYETEDEMREKLLYAINEGGGAFLFT